MTEPSHTLREIYPYFLQVSECGYNGLFKIRSESGDGLLTYNSEVEFPKLYLEKAYSILTLFRDGGHVFQNLMRFSGAEKYPCPVKLSMEEVMKRLTTDCY